MRYYKHLYMEDGMERRKEKIIKRLEAGKFRPGIYLVILSPGSCNQLEILNSILLLQPAYPKEDYLVVGLTKSYDEALELVEKITQEVYDKTMGAEIRSYILEKEQED